MRLGVDPKHADQMVRGTVVLPHGLGRTVRVLVFARGEKIKRGRGGGADFVGGEELAKKIEGGWLDFDAVVATPDMMRVVGRLGRVLGPRGLMPNPKTGTVTTDVAKAVAEIKAGKVEFRVDKTGIIQAPVGKVSFTRRAAGGERRGADPRRAAGQARRGQGQVRAVGDHLLDDGPGHPPSTRRRLTPGGGVRRAMALSRARKEEILDELRPGLRPDHARVPARLQGHHGAAGHGAARPGAREGRQATWWSRTRWRCAPSGHAARRRSRRTSPARPRWPTRRRRGGAGQGADRLHQGRAGLRVQGGAGRRQTGRRRRRSRSIADLPEPRGADRASSCSCCSRRSRASCACSRRVPQQFVVGARSGRVTEGSRAGR